MRILIAEDEVELAKGLKFLLEKNKFTVDIVHDGADALDCFQCVEYDVVVLDIMMPKVNGLEVLRHIRKCRSSVPALMLTANAEEFIARVKALSRRNMGYTDLVLSFGDVQLDCNRYELSCRGQIVRLNNKEFQLTELFLQHPHFVFSANHLMDKIWGQDSEADMNVVWTYIGFVRKKLRQIGSSVEIRTVRGAGYSLEG